MSVIGPIAPPRASSGGDLRDAARQLEAVFVGMMFEEMAKGIDGEDGLFPKSPGSEMYEQWFRSAVATEFSRSGGLGLGDLLAERFGAAKLPESLAPPPNPAGKTASSSDHRRPPPVVGPVTSSFGPRVHPVTGHPGHHNGVDIGAPVGTPVRVPFAGRVIEAGEDDKLGRFVKVEHRGGYRSLYAHLDAHGVVAGQEIDTGASIGTSGATGRVTGPHLHFAVYRDGAPVDPARFVRLAP